MKNQRAAGAVASGMFVISAWHKLLIVLCQLVSASMLTWKVKSSILLMRSGGTDAAEPCEPRQVREEAAVRRSFWVPSGNLSERTFKLKVKR